MASAPIYASTPRHENTLINVANPNRDGSGTIETIFTPGENGSIIDSIKVRARGITTAGMIRIYTKKTGGSWMLEDEFIVAPVTPSSALPAHNSEKLYTEFVFTIPPDVLIGASTDNAEDFNVIVSGGDF